MTKMMSLSKYEHKVLPGLRDQLNQAESVEDVKKFFVDTILKFLSLATDGNTIAEYEDISLVPDQEPYFSLTPQLSNDIAIKELANSDLDAILGRLAEQAANRYKHLAKNNTKTNLKIKNH
ncbi:hypothetical protein BMS3Bbin11_01011 [bacterium BMS3Bbin11]|nr:hypothetical protein BMS3Abin11_02194 [bacterium BMS3Abin11]GBE45918.1 hypothetical protein BMS3Bbin11_01011 [bacterium BMS3Bbin11]